jgi:gliding motility-associated-like protein
MKLLIVSLFVVLFSVSSLYGQTFNEIKKVLASDDASNDWHGFSVDIYGDYAIVGAPLNTDNGTQSGSVYIYHKDQGGIDNWGEVKKIVPSDNGTNDTFGFDVSIYGDNIAVGAHGDASFSGSVYIFNRNQGGANNWGQVKKLSATVPIVNGGFGIKVELKADRLVVGRVERLGCISCSCSGLTSGSAYVYYQNQGGANNWGLVKKITPSDGASSDGFGYLDLDGDILVVGALNKSSCDGAVYVYYKNQGGTDNWGQVKKITPPNSSSLPTFGLGISISGDNLAVGSYYESGGGYVYVYNKNQGGVNNWGLIKRFKGSTVSSGYWFSVAVALENDVLVVGAGGNGSSGGNGRAYVFKQNQGGTNNWGQTQILTASDGAYQDNYGAAIAIDQGRVVIGANQNDDGGSNSGSAYIFANCTSSVPSSVSASVNPICQGNSTTLSVVGGYLGNGATWEWYTGSCGGTSAGSGNSISVSPSSNTTYYVRAEGGCNITGCASLLVNVTVPPTVNNTTTTASICETLTKSLTGTPSGGTWSIVSGGGSISGTTYTAPSVSSNTNVIIKYRIPGTSPCSADSANVSFTVTNTIATSNTTTTTSICETGTKSLTGTPSGGTWSVVSGGGSILGTTYSPANISANTSVTIKYRTPGSGGCPPDSNNVTFTVEPTLISTITSSSADICNGDKRVLTGTPVGGIFTVVSGPGVMLANDTLQANASTGTIQVRYRVTNACGNKDTLQNINVNSTVTAIITSSSASLCEEQTRNLTGTPAGGTWTVLSGPGTELGGVLTPNGIGTVSIEYTVTSLCGTGLDTVNVIINPTPNPSAGLDENICLGDTAALIATGGVSYQWVPGSAMASQEVFPVVTTGYRVDVTSDSGCVSSDSVTVLVQNPDTAIAQNDQVIVTTGVQESINIYVNDLGDLNSIRILSGPYNGIASVSGGLVLYTSTIGYVGSDSLIYEICDVNCQIICDTAKLLIQVDNDLTIPTGISPNNDGKNDVFNILGLNKYSNNQLYIYNRWGSLVFEAKPYLNDWAGKSLNGEVIEGTYFYVLKLGEELPSYNGYVELRVKK